MADMVKFLKGTLSGYNSLATKDANSLYITTDEGGIYLGEKRLGDIVVVDSQSKLPSASEVSTSALYYITDSNVLARSNGSNWVQINAAGLTAVTTTGSGDYVTSVTAGTTTGGARAVTVAKASLANHATIKDHEDRLSDVEESLATLTGSGSAGSIADQIDAAVAPALEAAEAAQKTADEAVATNVTQGTAITDLQTRMGNAESDIADNTEAIEAEATARETAITNLVDGATEGYATLGDLEAKIKANAANIASNDGDISALQSRMSDAESDIADNAQAISDEVSARQTAITNLVGGETTYTTLKKVGDALRTQSSTLTNHTNSISDLDDRVSVNESAISTLNGDDTVVGSVDYKVAQEVAKILNDNDSSDIDTLEEIAAWIKNDTAGVGALNAQVNTNKNNITSLTNRMDTAESTIADNTEAIAAETEARETAITNLIDGATSGYATLGDLEAKIKANATAITGNDSDIAALQNRMSEAESDITAEVTAREAAITNLIDGATSGYATLGDLEAKIKAAQSTADGAVSVNATQTANITDLTTRMGTAESNIANNTTAISNEVTAREAAITALIGDAASGYNTLGKLEDKIQANAANITTNTNNITNVTNRVDVVEGLLTWGSF